MSQWRTIRNRAKGTTYQRKRLRCHVTGRKISVTR